MKSCNPVDEANQEKYDKMKELMVKVHKEVTIIINYLRH